MRAKADRSEIGARARRVKKTSAKRRPRANKREGGRHSGVAPFRVHSATEEEPFFPFAMTIAGAVPRRRWLYIDADIDGCAGWVVF